MTTLVTAVRGQLRHIRPLIPAAPAAGTAATSQDAHVRLLGPVALIGLIVYQAVGWAGISLALPSLPILAAVAGHWSRHRLTARPSTRGQCLAGTSAVCSRRCGCWHSWSSP